MKGGEMGEDHGILFLMKLIVDRASTLFASRTECPVTAAQGRVLMYMLRQAPRAVTQRELEKYMGVSHATMTGLIERIEAKGYVRTAFDGRDGRVKNVRLTEAVRTDHERVAGLLEELDNEVLGGLSKGDKRELLRMLEKMYENISK